jgi:hypothetical protein
MAMLDSVSEILEIIEKHPGRTTKNFLRLGYKMDALHYIADEGLARMEHVPGGMHNGTYRTNNTHYYPLTES